MITAPRPDYPSRAFAVFGTGFDSCENFDDLCARGDAIPIREDMWREIEKTRPDPPALRQVLSALSTRSLRAIVSFDDADTPRTVGLAETLGLMSRRVARPAVAALDKARLYASLGAAGLPCPEFATAQNRAELERALLAFGRPLEELIVKPSIGTGSIGVYRPRPSDTAGSVAKRVLASASADNGQFVVMRYLDTAIEGVSEFCADGVFINGEPSVLILTEKIRQDSRVTFQDRMMVSPPLSGRLNRLEEDVAKVLRTILAALACEACVFHVEFRFLEDGRISPIDLALRPGGGLIAELVRARIGLDLRICHVAAMLGALDKLRWLVNSARPGTEAVALCASYSAPHARPNGSAIASLLRALDLRSDVIAFHLAAELGNLPFAQPDIGLSLALTASSPREAVDRLQALAIELRLQ